MTDSLKIHSGKVAIVCCSNGQIRKNEKNIRELKHTLQQLGFSPVFSPYIYQEKSVFSGTAKERSESLMDFYRDRDTKAIFDISGGDIANEILPYLDYEVIANSDKCLWGYSDLTTVINAIYAKTGRASVLYQIRNLISQDGKGQRENFINTVQHGGNALLDFEYVFVQKENMQGIVVGGNIRCLLKLAGTQYWPDMEQKILLLESMSGTVPQMVTYLNQLKQIGVFEKIHGILLGTFTQMEAEKQHPDIVDLVVQYAGKEVPIAKTSEIGHGTASKAILIGKKITL